LDDLSLDSAFGFVNRGKRSGRTVSNPRSHGQSLSVICRRTPFDWTLSTVFRLLLKIPCRFSASGRPIACTHHQRHSESLLEKTGRQTPIAQCSSTPCAPSQDLLSAIDRRARRGFLVSKHICTCAPHAGNSCICCASPEFGRAVGVPDRSGHRYGSIHAAILDSLISRTEPVSGGLRSSSAEQRLARSGATMRSRLRRPLSSREDSHGEQVVRIGRGPCSRRSFEQLVGRRSPRRRKLLVGRVPRLVAIAKRRQ